MSRPLRYQPGEWSTVFVTGRCIHSRFLLTPSPRVNALINGVLERGCTRYAVRLHAMCFMSNHYHLLEHRPFKALLRSRPLLYIMLLMRHGLAAGRSDKRPSPIFSPIFPYLGGPLRGEVLRESTKTQQHFKKHLARAPLIHLANDDQESLMYPCINSF